MMEDDGRLLSSCKDSEYVQNVEQEGIWNECDVVNEIRLTYGLCGEGYERINAEVREMPTVRQIVPLPIG
jgi:hypothetical protein